MRLQTQHIRELLDATYAPGKDLDAWGREVSRAFGRVIGSRDSAFSLGRYQLGDDVVLKQQSWFATPRIERFSEAYSPQLHGARPVTIGRSDFLQYFFPRAVVVTQTEIEAGAGVAPLVKRARRVAGFGDVLGVILHPDAGLACTLSCAVAKPTKLGRWERTLLTRYGLHLETALRLRLAPESVAMVLGVDGRVLHSKVQGELATPIGPVERTRADAELRLAAWTALVDGRFSMVEREGRGVPRHYLLLENPPAGWARRGLTPVEASVVQQTARGLPGKLIAYSLGLSPAMVSTALGAASAKLGFGSTLQLGRALRVLLAERAQVELGALTAAEREVYELLLHGGTNREIGAKRGTSARTVANQVAAILRKTGAASRRVLQLAGA